MNDTEMSKLVEAINKSTSSTIEVVVNGKIKRIDEKLSEYIIHDMEWKKEKVEPLIEAHRTIQNVGTFLKWAAGIVVSTGVVIKLFVLEAIIR